MPKIIEGSVVARNCTMNDEHLGSHDGASDIRNEAISERAGSMVLIVGFGQIGAAKKRRAASMARANT